MSPELEPQGNVVDERDRILVIEDEMAIRDLLGRYLTSRGFLVSTASGGNAGLERIRLEPPDLVLLDLRMPDMDGLEVLSILESFVEETPVIIVSGAAEFEDAIEAIRLGAWDFLSKPIIDMRVLDLSIDKALDRRRLLVENRRYREHLEELVAERTTELVRELSLRREAESRLKESLGEKEAMLKEIHHRVKNNLQVISSLLSLQSQKATDSRFSELLRDSQNRVRSMAIIHEKIYRSDDLAQVNFSEYIRDITNYLIGTYPIRADAVRLITDLDTDVLLGVDVAVPFGLIVNELVTNSLKHAFKNRPGEANEIRIGLKARKQDEDEAENKEYRLTIGDNGVGMKEDVEIGDTLGLTLVGTLVDQIGGSIRRSGNHGTEYEIVYRNGGAVRSGD